MHTSAELHVQPQPSFWVNYLPTVVNVQIKQTIDVQHLVRLARKLYCL